MNKPILCPSFGVLLIDDEEAWLRTMSMHLALSGGINHVIRCQDSRQALEILATQNVGLVLLDLNMPHLCGQELLPMIVENHPDVAVIIVSGLNQIEIAVQCVKAGAFDFFVKTVEEERLIKGVQRAIQMIELQREIKEIKSRLLHDKLEQPEAFAEIITRDKTLRSIFQYIESVAQSTQPVLVTGESGVGKELVARAIHRLSGKPGRLVSVNVAGLDDNVFADTLFGHTRGAFTGAEAARQGMIEQAGNGTLFLDEIGDLSISSQVKLLRLLQEGEYFPLGSDLPKRLNARIVVATHQHLDQKQVSGEFRKDLYYRLCAHQVHIPPLRERREDIFLLFDHFLAEAARELGKTKPTIPRELPVLLANYPFPGNIRELKGMCYDAMSVHRDRMLSMQVFKRAMAKEAAGRAEEGCAGTGERRIFIPSEPLPPLPEVTGLLVAEAMKRAEGNQSLAARLIGISQPALNKRLKKMRAGS
jgi:DNA-binding NtrC family response regulator